MPRQRTYNSRRVFSIPTDFPHRLVWFKQASGLSWAEIARRLETHPRTMGRWRKGLARPSARHMTALLDLTNDLGLGNLFTD